MRIVKTWYLILITFCVIYDTKAQLHCPSPLYLCNSYFFVDGDFDDIDHGYFISIQSTVSNYSWVYTPIPAIDGIISFQTEGDFPSEGIYTIFSWEQNIVCEGLFINEFCADYLLPQNMDCNIEGGINIGITEETPCDSLGENVIPYNFRGFCLGDTSRINISPEQSIIIPNPLLPFSLDRLLLNNGYVISYDEMGFDVVWDLPGTECIFLNTALEGGNGATTAISVRVDEYVDLEIFADGLSTDYIEICEGESIQLSTHRYPNINTIWETDNGNNGYGQYYDERFANPGTYQIFLKPGLECNCAEADTLTIVVLPGDFPGIECTGTVCAGSEITYYSDRECGTYLWSVGPEGTIVDGGGPTDFFITIQWNTGPGGELSLSTPGCLIDACKETITEIIPIIDATASVIGPSEVCYGEQVLYSMLNYTGTDFQWTVDGPGYIIGRSTRNPVRVQWLESDPSNRGVVSVTYENCNLECSGSASLDVDLIEDISIDLGVRRYCEEANISVQNNLGYNVDWLINNPDGSMSSFPNSPTLNTLLSQVGRYTISLSNPNLPTCNETDEVTVIVFDMPNPPSSIDGPEIICKDNFVQYTIPNLGPYDIVHWQIYDGDLLIPTNEITSRNLTMAWRSDGPYQLAASIENSTSRCVSEALLEIYDGQSEMAGPDTICLATENTFTLSPYLGGEIEWSISPANAAEITYAQGDIASIVAIENGSFTVSASYCSFMSSIEVNVPVFDVEVTFDDIVCKEAFSSVQVTAPSGSNTSIKTFPGNVPVSTSNTTSLISGDYLVEVTSPYGCIFTEEINIETYDSIEVDITSPGPYAFCMPHAPIPIFAYSSGPGSTFMWYRNGVLLSETSFTLMATDYGNYHVVAVDQFGCLGPASEVISLFEPSGSSGPPLAIEQIDNTCHNKTFNVLAPFSSTEFSWSFGDGAGATGTSVNHTFTRAGYYLVTVSGNGGCGVFTSTVCDREFINSACEGGRILVVIPISADFTYQQACANSETQFIDLSTILPYLVTVIYEWTIIDPINGNYTSSEMNPKYTFTESGTYQVQLKIINEDAGCESIFEQSIVVSDLPEITMDVVQSNCVGYKTTFTASSTENDMQYFWQFGEYINGKEQTSREQNPEFTYTTGGNHQIRLTGTNQNDCSTTLTQLINITSNNLGGQINTDSDYPKCPGDLVSLTAPAGDSYLWSNNETSRQITVVDPGSYTVTVTDVSGCTYVPFPHLVSDLNLGNALISATEYDGNIVGQKTHYDSLKVCKGQPFTLQTTQVSNAAYTWTGGTSNGSSGSVLDYQDHFRNLSAGTYQYHVNARDTLSNCEADFGPFFVTIVDKPLKANLVSDIGSACFGDLINVTITNYDPNFNYFWNNGHTGASYTGIATNTLLVTVTNSLGCTEGSNVVAVRRPPSVNAWLTGCLEVCFPKEMCLNLSVNQTIDYTLIKDGEEIRGVFPPISSLSISEPGDYQLKAENIYGCVSISDVLSLDASPDEHKLSGIVYIDYNENGSYEATDSLLAGVPVSLLNGNTIVATTLTDSDGEYSFDPIFYSNLTTVLDLSQINLVLSGDLDSLLIFSECVEDKIINFPLINTCPQIEADSIFMVCSGEGIFIDGTEYFGGTEDTLKYTLETGCDSTFTLSVRAFEEPELATVVEGTCQDTDNGSLFFTIIQGSNLVFSIDNEPGLFVDTFVHDLSVGSHILYIFDNSLCPYSIPFEIPRIAPPSIDIIATSSCLMDENGSISINVLTGENLTFSLVENGVFTEDLLFGNLSEGSQILYYRDENNCDYSQPFDIDFYEEPLVNLEPNGTCFEQDDGDIKINIVSGTNLLFDIDENTSYTSSLVFNDLPDGEHTLYILDENGCEYTSTFTIPLFPEAQFEIEVSNACGSQDMGTLSIVSMSPEMTFSIDILGNFTSTMEYMDLDTGTHMIYALTNEGCLDSMNFIIESVTSVDIDFSVNSACENLGFGELQINATHAGELFAIDGGSFNPDLFIEGLPVGQHTLQYQYDVDCIFEFPFEILLIEEPTIELEATTVCEGDNSGFLNITTSSQDLLFSIDDINYSEGNTFSQLTAGQYTLYVQNTENCTYTYPFDILQTPLPSVDALAASSCADLSTGAILVSNLEEGHLLSLNGSEYSSDTQYENLPAGIYGLTLLDKDGCNDSITIEILENPDLEVEISIPENDCHPSAFTINPNILSSYGNLYYLWSDGSTESRYIADKTETVSLSISDDCHSLSFDWDIQFSPAADNNKLFVPNIFSPNEDGVNDCFLSALSPEIDLISYHQIIYDRWGNKMYESEHELDCWDGIYLEEPAITGVYVYITTIVVRDCNGDSEIRKIGDVTLLR